MLEHQLPTSAKRVANFLAVNASFINNLGVQNGKMGIAIFLFQFSRYSGNKDFQELARELINDIYKEINLKFEINFKNGLSGIGWGMEYLVRNNFIDANIDEILSDIDIAIIQSSISNDPSINDISNDLGECIYFATRILNSDSGAITNSTFCKKLFIDILIKKLKKQIIYKDYFDYNIKIIELPKINSLIWFMIEMFKIDISRDAILELFSCISENLKFSLNDDNTFVDLYLLNFLASQVKNLHNTNDFDDIFSVTFTKYDLLQKKHEEDNSLFDEFVQLSNVKTIFNLPDSFLHGFLISLKGSFTEINYNAYLDNILNSEKANNLGLDGISGIGLAILNLIFFRND